MWLKIGTSLTIKITEKMISNESVQREWIAILFY